jgi:hypothetical protein
MVFLVIAAVAYLAGAGSAAFVMVVIGIRKGDRPERILGSGSSGPETCARRLLRTGAWPDVPVYRADRDDVRPGRQEFPAAPR